MGNWFRFEVMVNLYGSEISILLRDLTGGALVIPHKDVQLLNTYDFSSAGRTEVGVEEERADASSDDQTSK